MDGWMVGWFCSGNKVDWWSPCQDTCVHNKLVRSKQTFKKQNVQMKT